MGSNLEECEDSHADVVETHVTITRIPNLESGLISGLQIKVVLLIPNLTAAKAARAWILLTAACLWHHIFTIRCLTVVFELASHSLNTHDPKNSHQEGCNCNDIQ